MNAAINRAGLPNTSPRLLLNRLNSAMIHLPGRAPERHGQEGRGEEGFISVRCSGASRTSSLPAAVLLCFSSVSRRAATERPFRAAAPRPVPGTGYRFQGRNLRYLYKFFFLMKICVVNYSSKAMSPEVACYCPLRENHSRFPGSVGRCRLPPRDGTGCPCSSAKEAFGRPQLLGSLWQQRQGEPDTNEATSKYEATKDRPSMQTACR